MSDSEVIYLNNTHQSMSTVLLPSVGHDIAKTTSTGAGSCLNLNYPLLGARIHAFEIFGRYLNYFVLFAGPFFVSDISDKDLLIFYILANSVIKLNCLILWRWILCQKGFFIMESKNGKQFQLNQRYPACWQASKQMGNIQPPSRLSDFEQLESSGQNTEKVL